MKTKLKMLILTVDLLWAEIWFKFLKSNLRFHLLIEGGIQTHVKFSNMSERKKGKTLPYLIVLLAAIRSSMWLSPFCKERLDSSCWHRLGPLPPLSPPPEPLHELFFSDDFWFCQLSLVAEFGKESSKFFLLLPERVEPKTIFNGLESLDMLGIFFSLSELRLQQAFDVLGLGEVFLGSIVLGSLFLVIRGDRAARFLRPYAALLIGEICGFMMNPFGHMSRAFCCNSCLRGLLRFFSRKGETCRKAGGEICRGLGARGLYTEGETLGETFWKGLNTGTKFLVGVFWSSCCFAKASEMKCGLLALANGLVDRIWVATVAIALIELVTTMTGLEESGKKTKWYVWISATRNYHYLQFR